MYVWVHRFICIYCMYVCVSVCLNHNARTILTHGLALWNVQEDNLRSVPMVMSLLVMRVLLLEVSLYPMDPLVAWVTF